MEEKEKSPTIEGIVSSLESLKHDLSANDMEAIKVIARRWRSGDKSVGEKEKAELLHSAYNQALNEAVKMLTAFSEHLEYIEEMIRNLTSMQIDFSKTDCELFSIAQECNSHYTKEEIAYIMRSCYSQHLLEVITFLKNLLGTSAEL